MSFDEKSIIKAACDHFGMKNQIIVCIEELSELTKALTKHLRGDDSLFEITEEAADVSIVLDEIMLMFGIKAGVQRVRREKIKRLLYRIEAEEQNERESNDD